MAGRVDVDGGVVVVGAGGWPVDAPGMRSSGTDGRTSSPVARGADAAVVVVVDAAAVVIMGSDGDGGEDDMVEPELVDTKVLGARVLGRRL